MGTMGTFDSFSTARLGIYAAQHGLRVTGNNISNINTVGYTRQRIDQVSLKTGAADMYRSIYDNHVGSGALVTGINQIRDPYLDIRYRNANSDVGYSETMLNGLGYIQSILDEVGKGENDGDGLLYAQLQKVAEALRELDANPTKTHDMLVRSAAEALVELFHTYAGKLEDLREQTEDGLYKDIDSVNEILTNIRNLNKSIRECEIHGDNALEMRDERNRQIDELSKYMHVNVVYTMEDIGAGKMVEKLTISLGNSNPDNNVTTDSSVLIDGIYGTQIDAPKTLPMANPDFDAKNGNPFDPQQDSDYRYLKEGGGFTNDPNLAVQVPNDNYIITLDKLRDERGREWESSNSVWTGVTPNADNGAVNGVKAVYEYQLNATSNWAEDDTLEIAGTVYTIGKDISVANANDSVAMASFIASKLNGKSPDYKITANNGTIIFTAKQAGAVGGKGPAAAPNLDFKANGAAANITFGPQDETTKGVDSVAPSKPPAGITKNPNGSETEISYTEVNGGWYMVTTVTQHTYPVTLDDNDLHGSLQATRELLTEAGEFATKDTVANVDESAAIKRGIPYYQKSLDLLALQFATQYNKLNMGYMVNQNGNYIDANNQELMLPGTDGVAAPVSKENGLTTAQRDNLINNGYILTDQRGNPVLDKNGDMVADIDKWLAENNAKLPEGAGLLFTDRNDRDFIQDGITASNIDISHSWSTGDVKLVPTHILLFGENGEPIPNTTQSENIGHMLTLINESLVYNPQDLVPDAVSTKLFTGSFNNMLSNSCTVLGNYKRIVNTDLLTDSVSLVDIDTSRDGVSGVDLNDEAMNMMQYQKAYSAACRLMTAIDEALDRLINNTGIAGR